MISHILLCTLICKRSNMFHLPPPHTTVLWPFFFFDLTTLLLATSKCLLFFIYFLHQQGANYGGARASSAPISFPENMICEILGGIKKYWQCVISMCNFSFVQCDHHGLLCKIAKKNKKTNTVIHDGDLNLIYFNKDKLYMLFLSWASRCWGSAVQIPLMFSTC